MINTHFLLHTQKHGHGFQVIRATNISMVQDSSFDPDKSIKFIIHGYRTGVVTWPSVVAQDILDVEDANCFGVYWGDRTLISYVQAVSNARVVGVQVAKFLASLQVMYKKTSFNVHIIGYSLGAHIAGFAGQKAYPRVQRITGLDPAGPLFEGAKNYLKLDASDAKLVDVIYTDTFISTSLLMRRGLGTNDVSGHLNFYPNGGRNQPGCDESPELNILSVLKVIYIDSCSHSRSLLMYRESIHNPAAFLAYRASSYKEFKNGARFQRNGKCVKMGYHLNLSTSMTGKFYLNTGGESSLTADGE
ncbi:pancreatic lipase-related protein 2-like [Anomaloglossus baeobatrachus]|uniref:pancreatic lipase-related protein 2-like n=1 Tax=Anomaloglossus baeobatrachus TaxID=238106 RepID=UPI003F504D09